MCVYTHTLPSPSQICLGRTPQHRLAGPSHTKPSLQPPDQLCSPLSTGGGAETRRGAVCPGVGKLGCKAAFLHSRTSELGAGLFHRPSSPTGPPHPLTGHPQSQDQHGKHQGNKGLSVPGTPTLGPCLVVLISAYQGQENEGSMSSHRPQVTLSGLGRDSNAGLFLHLPCMVPVLRGKWSGPQRIYTIYTNI